MNPKRNAIVEKGLMTKEELDSKIKELVSKGDARNENSAVMKVYRDVSIQDDGEQTVSGLWLTAYQRTDGTISGFLLTNNGPMRIGSLQEAPQPKTPFKLFEAIEFTGVVKKKNVFTGSEWLEAGKDTKGTPTELKYGPGDCLSKITDVHDSNMYVIGGHVRFVNTVGIFRDGEKVGDEPVLDNGKVNLRLVLEDKDGNQINCKVPDEDRLGMLLDGEDFAWLSQPDSVKELGDMLAFEEVIVFGQMSKFFGEPGKADYKELDKPFANITNFGFVVLNPA